MSDAPSPLLSALVGRYAVERLLGEGGMATVYLAIDVRHNRRVALKVLKPELAAVVGAARFLAEIETTAKLQHPHILPLFDSGESGGFLYYVMPYVEGETLRDRLDRERQLPVDQAVAIATDVAEALEYAHKRGVIHRDVKPANILLQDGKALVADFGIALALSMGGAGRLTETGLSLGTPHYMSPEQATGDEGVGRATDIYALGCVLYEMLVGEPPYTGSTPQAVLGKILTGEVPSATRQRASVPANVDAVIRRALEKVPADRFGSAGELERALHERGFRHGDKARSDAGRPSAWQAAALLGVGVAMGAAAMALWRSTDPTPLAADIMRFALPASGGDSLNTGGVGQDVAISRDGRRIAYTGWAAGSPQIYLRSLDQLEGVPLRGTEGGIDPFFSPDGAWVGFVDGENRRTLKRVPIDGGGALTIGRLSDSVSYVAGASWGIDGRIVVGTGQGTGLFRVSATGGTPESLSVGQYHWPWILEGRDAVLMMRHGAVGPEVYLSVLDLRTGEVRSLGIEGTSPRYLPTGHLTWAGVDGSVWAAPFDLTSLEVVGTPVVVLRGVEVKSETEAAANFAVSENGHLVYALAGTQRGASTNLVAVSRDGTATVLARLQAFGWYPRFSPDGSRVAVGLSADNNIASDSDLWVIDVARGARTRVTFGGNNRAFPTWTPDGAQLTHSDGTGDVNHLLMTAADGTGVIDTLALPPDRRFPTSWSPDGRTLAVTRSVPPTRDIWLVERGGSGVATASFIATPFIDMGAIFSPDGRWVAYVSDRAGQNDVYARPFPGPGAEVTVSVGGGGEPAWSPSGGEIFYRQGRDLVAVAIERTGSSLRVGTPRRLFVDPYRRDEGALGAVANYDVAPGGTGFVMVEDVAPTDGVVTGSSRLHVVLNWFEELRARVPR